MRDHDDQGTIVNIKDKEGNRMPGGNGTGPNGMGSMTGRGAGYCAGYGIPGSINPVAGRGAGFGLGRGGGFGSGRGGAFGAGRGRRLGFSATGMRGRMSYGGYAGVPNQNPDPESVRQALKNQADALSSELDLVKKRLSEMETETTAE